MEIEEESHVLELVTLLRRGKETEVETNSSLGETVKRGEEKPPAYSKLPPSPPCSPCSPLFPCSISTTSPLISGLDPAPSSPPPPYSLPILPSPSPRLLVTLVIVIMILAAATLGLAWQHWELVSRVREEGGLRRGRGRLEREEEVQWTKESGANFSLDSGAVV